jgi:hypothetical protein
MGKLKAIDAIIQEYVEPLRAYGDEDPVRAENIALKNKIKFVQHMLKDLDEKVWYLGSNDLNRVHEIMYKLNIVNSVLNKREDI